MAKLTDWINGEVNPTMPGEYEFRYPHREKYQFRAFYNGQSWVIHDKNFPESWGGIYSLLKGKFQSLARTCGAWKMTIKRPFILANEAVRQRVAEFALKEAPTGWAVMFSEPTRSLEQNSLLWPLLTCFSKQLQWPVNGELSWLSPEEWKTVLTGGLSKELRMAKGLDGGVVMLGFSTRVMPKKEFSELIEFIQYVAAERGVDLTRK